MDILRGLVRVWDRFNDAVMVLAGILFWGQMVIVNIEVISRYLGRPTTWVSEISSILVLWIPFMIAGWVLRREGHVKMDLAVERLSPGLQAMINFVTSLVGFLVMLIVAGFGLTTTISWVGNKTPTVLMLPRSPIIAVIFIGSLLFSIQFLIRAFDHFALWRKERAIGRERLQDVSPNSGGQRGAR